MKRLCRCALAALLAASFAAPVLASPPPVKAPPAFVVTSASLPTLIVSVPTPTPTPEPTVAIAHVYELAPTPAPTVQDAQAYALAVLGATEYRCLFGIIQGESRWRPYVWNTKGSGAYGLGQAKPASKMAPYGADYMTNPVTQVKFVIGYTAKKYGSACGAAAFRATHGWY